MANIDAIIRPLEIQLESTSQDLAIAQQRIARLEVELENVVGSDPTYVSNESQLDFIRKVADSRTKFAKEAQDIIAAIDGDSNV
jgi:hypothetical protein